MKNETLAAVALLAACLLACSEGPHERLRGIWQSDRDATLANVEQCKCVTAEQRTWLEENLGKLTVEYTASTMTARLADWTDAGPYAVLEEGENWADLRRTDLPEEEATVHRVWVEGDRMWVRVAHLGFEEVFRRLE
jgi:hypothetical protein